MAIDGRSYTTVKVSNGTTVKIEYRDFATSTAALAKEYAIQGYPDRYAVFTEHQSTSDITGTQLREGDLEKGIFLSLILRPSFFLAQAAPLGLLSVVSLTQTLESYTTKKLGISWVSDIFCEGVKIGGTQIEGKIKDFNAFDYIIVTFAAKIDEKNFPPRLEDSVKRIFEKENLSLGMMMAKTILDKFFIAYSNIKTTDNYSKYYKSKFVLTNAKIKYIENGKRKSAVVVGIDTETMSLLIKTRNKEQITVSKPSSVIIPSRIKIGTKGQKQ
jgi:BirA family biotin operon repressor/biotin-[acetyl-CoA-carboxylase] ligase